MNYPLNIFTSCLKLESSYFTILVFTLMGSYFVILVVTLLGVTLPFLNSHYTIASELMMLLTTATVLILYKSCMPSSHSVLALRLWLGADTLYNIYTPLELAGCF